MAKKTAATADPEAAADAPEGAGELEEIEELEDVDSALEDGPDDLTDDAALLTDEDDLDDGAEEGEEEAGLEELGAAELNMLTEDEAAEALRVDEAAEVESLRKAELALQEEGDEISADEFVCSSCFLMKRTSQLANKSKKICKDCAA